MNNKYTDLETKIAFLEQNLNELSDVIYQQQKQIDALEKQNVELKENLLTLREDTEASDKPISHHIEKPPHY